MLPIGLVLLVATSALAAPSVVLDQYSFNEVARPRNNGKLVSSYVTSVAFDNVDGGDTVPYVLTVEQILNDMANLPDKKSQALALGQTLAVLSQLAVGVPGDACVAANAIDAYVSSGASGSRRAVSSFVKSLISSVESIVSLANNPNAVRYAVGPRGSCNAGGRSYAFEAAWDSILSSASSSEAGLLNEQYCAAKRLYSTFSVKSNNIGAYVTAASLPPVVSIIERALEPLARFLASPSAGNGASVQKALSRSL